MNTVTMENADEVARVTKGLLKEFADAEIKIKPAKVSGNRALALRYIDARCVMDRLDEVVGINNWRDEYTVLPNGEVECRLSVRIAGEWITKADVGGQSEQPDDGDKMKAAYSDALKRVAVKFGIGRFLYRMAQQWMDYDPVKKQIIRPDATRKPQPAQPTKLAPAAALAKLTQDYAQCNDATRFAALEDARRDLWSQLTGPQQSNLKTLSEDTKKRMAQPAAK